MNEILRNFLTGNLPKKHFGNIFLPLLGGMVICWFIARWLLPVPYYMTSYAISRQGNIVQNPVGSWFFIISTGLTGIFLIFYFLYLYRRLLPSVKLLCRLFLLCGIIGGIGLTFVGIFPEQSDLQFMHNIGSTMAFSGLGVGGGLSALIMFIRILQKRPWPTLWQLGGVVALCLQFMAMMLFIEGWSVFQWTGFYTIYVWCVGMFLISPEIPEVPARSSVPTP
jgi:hypothetical protein